MADLCDEVSYLLKFGECNLALSINENVGTKRGLLNCMSFLYLLKVFSTPLVDFGLRTGCISEVA